MKFLWESNAPWAGTGYGQQTKLMLGALQDLGHEPVCFCFYGLSGGAIEYDGYLCLPNSDFEAWGNDVIKAHIERSRAECVVTLMDLFVLDTTIWQKLDVPWVAWVPIDSVGIGHMTTSRLELVDFPIAMSLFGAQQMMDHDIEPAGMIYHAVDTEVYKPLDKYECRELLGIPENCYLVGMVMANKSDRKQYPLQLHAIKQWMDKNPDYDIRVYIHTEPTSAMGGWDIRELVKTMGLKGKVYSTNQYDTSVVPMGPDMMAKIYNAFDVTMNCSAGEGFGIPIIESQACGVPVITTGETAMPELTHNGYTVEVQGQGLGSHFGWQFMPSVEDMVYRLECVYRMLGREQAALGRAWVENNCSLPVIAEQWAALLTDIEGALQQAKAEAKVKLK